MKRRTLVIACIAALALAGAGYSLFTRGLASCGWSDRLTKASGCLGSQRFEGVRPTRASSALAYDDAGRMVMSASLRTADGWRGGLIVLDPVTGAESGRYPVPMRTDQIHLIATPDAGQFLLTCRGAGSGCYDSGRGALLVDRETLSQFTPYAMADRFTRDWPGTPRPDAQTYGEMALFGADGARIVSGKRRQNVQIHDRDGTLLADTGLYISALVGAALSPDGKRIALWDERAGPGEADELHIWDLEAETEVLVIRGSPGWRLRAPPFWSADAKTLFTPRSEAGTMILSRFAVP